MNNVIYDVTRGVYDSRDVLHTVTTRATESVDPTVVLGGALLAGMAISGVAKRLSPIMRKRRQEKDEEKRTRQNAMLASKWPSEKREGILKLANQMMKQEYQKLSKGGKAGLIAANAIDADYYEEELEEFINGTDSSITLMWYDLWEIHNAVGGNPREYEMDPNGSPGDVAIYEVFSIGDTVKKMLQSKGYQVDIEYTGDWDDGPIELVLK